MKRARADSSYPSLFAPIQESVIVCTLEGAGNRKKIGTHDGKFHADEGACRCVPLPAVACRRVPSRAVACRCMPSCAVALRCGPLRCGPLRCGAVRCIRARAHLGNQPMMCRSQALHA